jgi:Protein of unknown function (DUF3119)
MAFSLSRSSRPSFALPCGLFAVSRSPVLRAGRPAHASRLKLARPHPRTACMCAPPGGEPNQPVETTLVAEDGALDVDGGRAVVIRPDLRLASAFTFAGGAAVFAGDGWLLAGFPLLALGAFLYIQTARVRFVFGPTALNVAMRGRKGDLKFIRGWAYSDFAVWDIYPSPSFPVLAYFRERESYNGKGSIHFFPCLGDGQQLVQMFEKKTGRARGGDGSDPPPSPSA